MSSSLPWHAANLRVSVVLNDSWRQDWLLITAEMVAKLERFVKEIMTHEALSLGRNLHLSVDMATVGRSLGIASRQLEEASLLLLDSVLSWQSERKGLTVVSAFSSDFYRKGFFSKENSPSYAGFFCSVALSHHNQNRGDGPIFSFTSFSSDMAPLGQFVTAARSSFGPDSTFSALIQNGFTLISIGHHYSSAFTIAHHFEELLGVDYRFLKRFHGRVIGATGVAENFETEMFVKQEGVIFSGLTSRGNKILMSEKISRFGQLTVGDTRVLVFACELSAAKDLFLGYSKPSELIDFIGDKAIRDHGCEVLTLPASRIEYLRMLEMLDA